MTDHIDACREALKIVEQEVVLAQTESARLAEYAMTQRDNAVKLREALSRMEETEEPTTIVDLSRSTFLAHALRAHT